MAFVTIADTGLISYVSTRNLAERWGFGPLSWLYPLCLDAVAAVGMDLWMSHSPARRTAKWLVLFAVALSLAANVVDWLYVGFGAAVLGAVPPLMLAALLLTMHRHVAHTADQVTQANLSHISETGREAAAPTTADVAERTDQARQVTDLAGFASLVPPDPVPARNSRGSGKGPKLGVSDDVVVAALREHEMNGDPLSRRRVMEMFHIGTNRANRLLAETRNGVRDTVSKRPQNGTQLNLAVLSHGPDTNS